MSATVDPTAFISYFPSAQTIQIPGKTNYPITEYFLEDIYNTIGVPEPADYRQQRNQSQGRRGQGGAGREYETFYAVRASPPSIDAIERDLHVSRNAAIAIDRSHKGPIEEIDYPLIVNILQYLHRKTDINESVLVFLTGMGEITALSKLVQQDHTLSRQCIIFPVHSMLPTVEQRKIFQPSSSLGGKRKVILATNIAETSITVEDVVHVIDCGKIKQTSYDPMTGLPSLKTVIAAKANGQQRRGRAGRVRPGTWFRLYSRYVWDRVASSAAVPEMQRAPVEELALNIKALRLGGIEQTLSRTISPPPPTTIQEALTTLRAIGAIDEKEELTHVGRQLAEMPIHPRLGKLILFGAMFGCLDPILTVAASLGAKSPFFCPPERAKEADAAKRKLAGEDCHGDHILMIKAFSEYAKLPAKIHGGSWDFCNRHFLSPNAMQHIANVRSDLERLVKDYHIDRFGLGMNSALTHEHQGGVIEAVLSSGLHPALLQATKRSCRVLRADGIIADVHPGSILAPSRDGKNDNSKKHSPPPYGVYFGMQRTTQLFCYDCTKVSPLTLLLFCRNATKHGTHSIALNNSPHHLMVLPAEEARDLMMQLRSLVQEEFIPAVVGRTVLPHHRAALTVMLHLLTDADKIVVPEETKGDVGEEDADDEDDVDDEGDDDDADDDDDEEDGGDEPGDKKPEDEDCTWV